MVKYIVSLFFLTVAIANAQNTVSSGRLDILRDVAEDGFLRAINVKPFSFPADHGPHPGYKHEWWYLTGNLENETGRKFGYELTFFRLALKPETETNQSSSQWNTPVAFAAHFAVTDVEEEEFKFFHRYSRGDGRLAGADTSKVWLDDWRLTNDGDSWTLEAAEGNIELALSMKQIKPMLLNGEKGLSRKSETPGNASYYYALTRLESSGTLKIGESEHKLKGLTWLDREWGTSALSGDQQGWDWYALHLSDGSDLMFYNLRKFDGSRHPYSAGSWVSPDGEKTALTADDIDVEVTDYWDSPLGGTYPSGWKISWKNKDLDLEVKPMIEDQELNVFPRYWEGAVDVSGTQNGAPIVGSGYVELTGYAN